MVRPLLLAALLSLPAAAGRPKIIEAKGMPKTIPALAAALAKEKKDGAKRASYSLALDDLLRAKAEENDMRIVDELAYAIINDVLDRMCEPTDVFTTEPGPAKFNPRADVILREQVKVRPDRVSVKFHRRYQKKPQGKNIDRAHRNQPVTFDFAPAETEEEWVKYVDTQGWGVLIHAVHHDSASGVARVGLTWVSPGTKEKPGGTFERPAWVGFYKRPGTGTFALLGLEPELATDWREQPINVVPPKTEPSELTRKLSLAVWMEQVRATPNRPAFLNDEGKVFALDLEGNDRLEAAQAPWLEKYRDSDSPMVRAAVEIKLAELGAPWKKENVDALLKQVKHPVVKAKLEELAKAPPAAGQ
jgi:hypothetical protein